eukprot:COSAG05_NODE_22127_length_267_cov_0.601190_1_plen_80_part_01
MELEGAHSALVDARAVLALLRATTFTACIYYGTVTLEQVIARQRYKRHVWARAQRKAASGGVPALVHRLGCWCNACRFGR